MKTPIPLCYIVALSLLSCGVRAQTNALEDRPFEPSASVVKGTVAALADSSDEVAALAVRSLSDWRQASAAADVANLLGPATPEAVRMEAFQFFTRLGAEAKPHVADVLKYAKDPNPNIRAAVLAVVFAAQASAENEEAIWPLIKDSRSDVRAVAAKCLGQAGKAAEPHRKALVDMLATAGSPEFKAAVLHALAQIPGSTAADVDAILPFIRDRDAGVRIAACAVTVHELVAAKTAGLITDEKVKTVRDALLAQFQTEPPEIRAAMLQDAAKNKATAKGLLEIAARLKDEDQTVRSASVRALGAAGPAAKPYLLDIVRFFNDDPAVPPYAAVEAVMRMSPLTPQELTSLLYPLYVYSDLRPLTRLAAYSASGGDRDDLLIIRLLGQSNVPIKDAVTADDKARATALLQNALKAPLLHEKLKAEINSRLSELAVSR